MGRKGLTIGFSVLFLLFTVAAHADTTVTMTLVGVGGAHQNGVYVAPYLFKVDGGPTVGMMCDDFTHDDHVPETYTAIVSTGLNLTNARFYDNGAGLQGYKEAFWLYSQYLLHPTEAGNINFAVWAIFDPSIIGNATYWNSAEQAWLTKAQTADLSHFDFSYFRVYTPTDSSKTSPQEMITTPEPATMALFGSGLMALAGLVRRRSKV